MYFLPLVIPYRLHKRGVCGVEIGKVVEEGRGARPVLRCKGGFAGVTGPGVWPTAMRAGRMGKKGLDLLVSGWEDDVVITANVPGGCWG